MKNYKSEDIRNICLLGHGSSGKTTLAEAMLFEAKVTDRFGSVIDGTTVCDYDAEEIKRSISINATVAPFEWKNSKINIVDTPGYFDFAGEVMSATKVAETAIICVPAKNGPEVGTEKAWTSANEAELTKMFFISKLDEENADYFKTYEALRAKFGNSVVAFEFPIFRDRQFIGLVDVIHEKAKHFEGNKFVEMDIPEDCIERTKVIRDALMEAIAETDEELMEKFFEGEAYTPEEISKGVLIGVEEGMLVPVYCGSAITNAGIQLIMDAIVEYVPAPTENKTFIVTDINTQEEIELKAESNERLAAIVFKTIVDPFVGKISLFKVLSGEIKKDTRAYNSRTKKVEKLSNLFTVRGKKQETATLISSGDIGAVAKISDIKTNDTLSDEENPVKIDEIVFPSPVLALGIEPVIKGDEEKITSGIHKLMDEDPTLYIETNRETHQTLISGIGDQQISVATSKLKERYNVKVVLVDPIIAFRETIKKKVKVQGKYKKQSGGHGQYGDIWVEFEPGEGTGLTFEEKIFGGSVPKNYIPAVEKGLKDSIKKGVLAGYPMVGLKATLVDGSYHPVDSSEMAFKMAANAAYKKITEASPILLEPINKYTIIIPNDYMGDTMGDLNKRRGRIMGMTPIAGGLQSLEAEVPHAEMFKYATDLRSMTHGRGKFSFEFVKYEEIPAQIAKKIVEDANKED